MLKTAIQVLLWLIVTWTLTHTSVSIAAAECTAPSGTVCSR